MKYPNPYTPGAGFMPAFLAGREHLLDEAEKYLDTVCKMYPQQSVIYYGLRGVGKTVLLNAIEQIADNKSVLFEHIEIKEIKNKNDKGYFEQQIANMCKKFIHAMSVKATAQDMIKKAWGLWKAFSVTYNGQDSTLSVGLNEDVLEYTSTGDLSVDLTELFVTMGKIAKGTSYAICFFIDEIQYMRDEELEAVINAIHRCNQLRLPIMIFGAGLPKIIKSMGEVKSYTERLFKFEKVDALKEDEAREAIIQPALDFGVEYAEDALKVVIEITGKYPYFIQEFCSTIWDSTEESLLAKHVVEDAVSLFLERLDQSFFKARYDRSSPKERQFMFAMVKCGELPCTISNIAKILKKEVKSISPMRGQLINKGLIYATGYAEIDFTVPQFDDFLRRKNPSLELDM